MFIPAPLRLVARASEAGTVEWHLLLEAIDMLSDERRERVMIDVAIDNERSPGLYRSCSFVVTTAYGVCDLVA